MTEAEKKVIEAAVRMIKNGKYIEVTWYHLRDAVEALYKERGEK